MANTREVLIERVKSWIQIDNQIREHQQHLKILRKSKKGATDDLVEIMKSNEIDCLDVKDGKLLYKQNKHKAPLSKKHLLNALSQYFPNDKAQVENISSYIMESREDRIKEAIERKIPK